MTTRDALSIVRLPLEILEVITEFSAMDAQLCISRVSKLFHSITLRALYRNLSLRSPRAVVGCCRTLVSNGRTTATVRSFVINYAHYPSSSNSLLASYYSLIRKALLSLSDIHTLKLLVHDPYYVTLLNHCMFPTLRQFECLLTPSTLLIKFLNRHPRINYLQVSPHENTSEFTDDGPAIPTLELPRLQYFAGNVQSVPVLRPTILRAAIITWNAMDTDPDLAFSALQHSRDTLGVVSCRRRGWNLDLFNAISLRLPEVISLHISNVLLVDSSPSDDYLQTIRTYLARFNRLQRLTINCIDYWEMGNITSQIEKDFATVTEWGDACPSLVEITLPHSKDLSWYRISENVWIPDPQHTAGGSWLYNTIVLKRHPSWNTFVDGLEDRLEKTTPATPTDYIEIIATVRLRLGGMLREKKDGAAVPSLPRKTQASGRTGAGNASSSTPSD